MGIYTEKISDNDKNFILTYFNECSVPYFDLYDIYIRLFELEKNINDKYLRKTLNKISVNTYKFLEDDFFEKDDSFVLRYNQIIENISDIEFYFGGNYDVFSRLKSNYSKLFLE